MNTNPDSHAPAASTLAVVQPVVLHSYFAAYTAADGFTYFEVQKVFGSVEIPSAGATAPAKGPFAAAVTARGAYFNVCAKFPTRALVTRTREGCKWAWEQIADLLKALRKLAAIVGGATAINFAWAIPGVSPPAPPPSDPNVAVPIVCHVLPSVCARDKAKSN